MESGPPHWLWLHSWLQRNQETLSRCAHSAHGTSPEHWEEEVPQEVSTRQTAEQGFSLYPLPSPFSLWASFCPHWRLTPLNFGVAFHQPLSGYSNPEQPQRQCQPHSLQWCFIQVQKWAQTVQEGRRKHWENWRKCARFVFKADGSHSITLISHNI